MAIQAVLFDIDNTLLDWSGRSRSWFEDPDGHLAHLARAARVFDPHVTEDQILVMAEAFQAKRRTLVEEDIDEAPHLGRMVAHLLYEVGITAEVPSAEAALEAYDWVLTPGVQPFSDVAEGLSLLRSQGLTLGIITNGYQPMQQRERELEHFGLLGYFSDCRFSSADVGVLKPDKRIFDMALDCLKLPADQAAYVGDDLFMDILGAQGAGMKAIWRQGANQADALATYSWIKPDGIILRLSEVLPLLERWV